LAFAFAPSLRIDHVRQVDQAIISGLIVNSPAIAQPPIHRAALTDSEITRDYFHPHSIRRVGPAGHRIDVAVPTVVHHNVLAPRVGGLANKIRATMTRQEVSGDRSIHQFRF
jgi:hypothetical protein